MMKSVFKTITILLIAIIPVSVSASGTTAADFLNISVSAYQVSVGGACNALYNGIASSYYNPAGLSSIEQTGINLTHNIWYQDISYEFVGAAMPLTPRATVGLAASYLNIGEIKTFDASNQQVGSVNPFGFVGIVSYSHKIIGQLDLGINGKYILEKLADVKAAGMAFDLGARLRFHNFAFGLAANNIGPKMKYDIESFSLPASVSFGTSYSHDRLPVSVMAGVKVPFEGGVEFSTGIDYQLTHFLSLRSGMGGLGADNISNSANFGAGLNLKGGSIDYAFNPGSQFGSTHFFTFTYSFGKVREMYHKNRSAVEPETRIAAREEIITAPDNAKSENTDIKTVPSHTKPVYIVSAGLFIDKASALKRLDILKQFRVKGEVDIVSDGKYRVYLVKTVDLNKAEKVLRDTKAKGIECALYHE